MHATDTGFVESFQGLGDEAFLRQAYLSLLGRAPDPAGAAAYLARLRSGVSRVQVWSEIASADEARRFASRNPAGPAAAATSLRPVNSVNDLLMLEGVDFVRQAYRSVLGREADASGMRDYAMRLASGTSKQQLLADLRCDPEGQARGATLVGLDEMVRQVQAGGAEVGAPVSLDDLLVMHGQQFVRAAYLILFKREPDPQGLARYLELLRSGFSTMFVLKALYEAPEALEKSARLPGLKAAIRRYDKAQLRSWKGWYHRAVMGAPSELPRERQLRAMVYRLLESKG